MSPCYVCGKAPSLITPCGCMASSKPFTQLPTVSRSECQYCGKSHGIFKICTSHPRYIKPLSTLAVETTELELLYNELGTLKWLGSTMSWDTAIDAVRKEIKCRIGNEKE